MTDIIPAVALATLAAAAVALAYVVAPVAALPATTLAVAWIRSIVPCARASV
jgi:hypothetical protein